jgi:predicted RNA binding protein YcfA (HicA-like mRNA interferase family)
MYDSVGMNGGEFIRRVRKIGKARGVEVRFEPRHGKGSHGRLYYGTCFTTVKDRKKEIGPGLLAKMLRDLELTLNDLEAT